LIDASFGASLAPEGAFVPMNPKVVFASALVAAGLLALFARHRPAAPAEPTTAPVPSTKTGAAEPDHARAAFDTGRRSRAADTKEDREDTLPRPATTPTATDERNSLGIPGDLLKDARKTAQETAARIAENEAALGDARYFNQSLNSGNPAKKLSLRLELDPASAQTIEDILSAAHAEQIKERMDAQRARLEREARLLAEDRENYVSYLALQAMLSRGATLSAEQQAFHDTFRLALGPDDAPASTSAPVNWYEDAAIIDAMNRQLAPAKQLELATYVAEQKNRDEETRSMHAQMRANQIAGQLGLSRADQSTLLEYLRDNPEASNSEIQGLLPSELKALLPAGM
jgi:hypothetical protein